MYSKQSLLEKTLDLCFLLSNDFVSGMAFSFGMGLLSIAPELLTYLLFASHTNIRKDETIKMKANLPWNIY